MTIQNTLTDHRTIKATFPASTAVAEGDLMWNDSGTAKKASQQADQGSETSNQETFATKFLGVSADKRLSTETSTGERVIVADGIFDCDCASTTFTVGDLIGPVEASNGTELENQKVAKVTVATRAIGYCIQGGTSLTKVRCRLISYYLPNVVYRGNLDASLADDVPLILGTGSDVNLLWSTGDADNHTLVVGLGDSNQALHITDKAAIATDWNVGADTHPTVYLHSNTTPATDYIKIGAHDGTVAWLGDMVGGDTIKVGFDGLEALVLKEVASAVNEVQISNAATATSPIVEATGSDTNIGLKLKPKGTGVVERATISGVGGVGLMTVTNKTTVGNVTYTAAELKGGLITRDPAGGARTDTLPTAADLVAAFPGVAANTGFEFIIKNTADMAETITIQAGSGGTLSGDGDIAQNEQKRFLVVMTNVTGGMEAYTVYNQGPTSHNT